MSDLPKGWIECSLEELCGTSAPIVYGIIQPGPDIPNGVPYVRPTELVDGGIDIANLRTTSPKIAKDYERSTLEEGDIILAIVGTIGKLAIVPKQLAGANITQSSARIRPPRWMPSSYLAYALKSPFLREQYDKHEFGNAVRRLNLAHVRELRVLVPPAAEQRRIVSKLESLTAKSRRAKEALDAVPALLERFRQSVLASAFRGDLTADWREKNPDVEPAEVLLKRIRAERRRRWEEAELAKMRAKGKVPGDDRWKEKYEEPEPVNAEGLPELPEGWCWASLGLVAPLLAGYAFSSSGFRSAGVRLLKGVNVRDGWISTEELEHWDPADVEKYSHFRLDTGDIVLAMDRPVYSSGTKATKVAELDEAWNGALLLQRVGKFQASPLLLRKYLYLFVSSHVFRNHLIREQNGSQDGKDLPHVSASMVDSAVIPVPPLAEQEAIVRATAASKAFFIRMRANSDELANLLLKLDASILSKAFRGELVAQDPSDEPASVLLERLRGEGSSTTKEKPQKTGRRGAGARKANRLNDAG